MLARMILLCKTLFLFLLPTHQTDIISRNRISLGSLNTSRDARDSIMTHRSGDDIEAYAYGSNGHYAMKNLPDVVGPVESTRNPPHARGEAVAAGEATKTKVYEPSLTEPATDVTIVHEIDLGLETDTTKDRDDDGGELDTSPRVALPLRA